ncbi:interferon regulatory factor 4-like isoform X2 [Mya arenaria]|uniref:interferon regulatory factor 4-like isoform X2 n=1 Tax=Mya arenaria TaxID=6604 RepID=UPI0022DEC7EE|nr:interferon regulatory factor 4-like isoform X2 [Mya arenaria]
MLAEREYYTSCAYQRNASPRYYMGHWYDGVIPDMSNGFPVAEQTRQRMKPWLEYHINSGNIPGLHWLDKDKKIFKVPWKHVGNREWSESDGAIFKEWAVHTGRFREGVDTPDWPTWKTRFRCALTKLPDIKELKEFNRLDGQTDEPYRVYQFVPRINGDTIVPAIRYAPAHTEVKEESSMHCETYTHPVIPTTVNTDSNNLSVRSDRGDGRLTSDLERISESDLLKISGDMNIQQISIDQNMDITDEQERSEEVERQAVSRPSTINPINFDLDESDSKLYVMVNYLMRRVYEGLCSNPAGCRIFHDTQVPIADVNEYREMFGPEDAAPIRLPALDQQLNMQQQRLTDDLLLAADRGLVLHMRAGSIYAIRKCRCRIYISSPSYNNGDTMKLDRDVETNIFDLQNYFKPALQRFLHQRGPKPSAEVIISFGQKFEPSKDSMNDLLISAAVIHAEAFHLLTRIMCSSSLTPTEEFSNSDQIDRAMGLRYDLSQPM